MPDTDSDSTVWGELRSQRDILIELRTLNREVVSVKDDHEVRIRRTEERLSPLDDHEIRIKSLEERKFPLPTVAVLVSMMALVMSVVLYVTTR